VPSWHGHHAGDFVIADPLALQIGDAFYSVALQRLQRFQRFVDKGADAH
jgi:hypothetical protein